jgi:voltage-gated potassium channel
VLPFWFAFLLPADLRVVLVLRMIRFLKITRYSPAMRSCSKCSTASAARCLAVA